MTDDDFQLFSRPKALKAKQELVAAESKTEEPVNVHVTSVQEEDSSAERTTFAELGLNPWLCDTLHSLAMHQPTIVQKGVIGAILSGQDVIASARTGSGKTAAFGLPILQSLSSEPFGVFALVLTPTRELAYQISEQFRALGRAIQVRVAVIVGGVDIVTQGLVLNDRPHIVIATPGRLADHINNGTAGPVLKRLRYLVLDEADRLMDPSFAPDLETLLDALEGNKQRQTLLFSATMTPELESVRGPSGKPPFIFRACESFATVKQVTQQFLFIPSRVRDVYLAWLLRNPLMGKTIIIFTGKCKTCELLRVILRELGFRTACLHAQLPQSERLSALARFKGGHVPILLATDVGSRGLDIPTVQCVINYDVPASAADYVHRIGRTARAGRGGMALTLASEMDVSLLENIESKTQVKMQELSDVKEDSVLELLNEVTTARRVASMHLVDTGFDEKMKKKRNNLKKEEIMKNKRHKQ